MPAVIAGTRHLEWLRDKRDNAVLGVTSITDRAADEDRDLTDEEHGACERRRSDIEGYDREIAVEVETLERQAKYEELSARIEPQLTRTRNVSPFTGAREAEPEMAYRSAGEYLRDYLLMAKEQDPKATDRLTRYRSSLQRANQTTAETPGVIPTPVLGPVLNDIDTRRPAIDAATRRPMPAAGKSFTRPRVSQHTLVGKHSAEKAALPSRAMTVDDLTVTKSVFGGTVNLSWEARDWTDPAILDLLISDLAFGYAAATDADFCNTLVAAVTQTVTASNGATPAVATAAAWLSAIYEGAALVFAAGNATPNVLFTSPDVWASLGSLVDGSGRPMFATLSPSNTLGAITPGAQGGNVAGFRTVVDANFPAGTAILGDSIGAEFFEQVGGTVSAIEPSILGTDIAYYGYAASVVVRPEAFVSITSV